MLTLSSRPYWSKQVLWFPAGNDIALHDLEHDKYWIMSDSAKYIWELIGGNRTVEEIARCMCERYDVSIEVTTKDCFSFVEELVNLGCLECKTE